jgi:hypothetical protein
MNRLEDLQLKVYTSDFGLNIEEDKLCQISTLYGAIFASPPWNEYKICDSGHYLGLDSAILTKCRECNRDLKLAYPPEEVKEEMKKNLSRGGVLTTFEKSEHIVGAAWGYTCTLETACNTYETEEMKKIGLAALKNLIEDTQIFYFSEMMVDPKFRNLQLATRMSATIVENAKQKQLKIVLHTLRKSPMFKIANKIGLKVLDLEDREKSDRVLFIT